MHVHVNINQRDKAKQLDPEDSYFFTEKIDLPQVGLKLHGDILHGDILHGDILHATQMLYQLSY